MPRSPAPEHPRPPRWFRCLPWAALLLATAMPGLADPAPAAPRGPSAPALGSAAQWVDLPPDPAFQSTLDLDLTDTPLSEVIEKLKKEPKLPLALAQELGLAETRVTLKLKGASVEAVLSSVAASLSEGYRWRRQGDLVVLGRTDEQSQATAIGLPAAARDHLRRALAARGILGVAAPPMAVPVDPRVGHFGLTAVEAARELVDALDGAVGSEALAAASLKGGVPFQALPPAVRERALQLTFQTARHYAARAVAASAARISTNPLVSGVLPPDIRIGLERDRWVVRYGGPGVDPGAMTLGRR